MNKKKVVPNLDSLAQTVPGVIYRIDLSAGRVGRVVFLNAKMKELCGYSSSDFLSGKVKWFNLVVKEDLPIAKKTIEVSSPNKAYRLEYRIRHKKGDIRWVLNQGYISVVKGKPVWSDGIILDISQSKKNELSLRESEKLLNQTNHIAKIGGWEIDLKTKNIRWSQEIFRIREIDTPVEHSVKKAMSHYTPEARLIIKDALGNAIESGIPWDLELLLITAKGNRKWIRDVGIPEMVNGKCVRLQGTLQDITERKKNELQNVSLSLELEQFKTAVSAATIVSIADLKGTIKYANQKFQEISHYTIQELVGRKHNIINSGYHPKSFWKKMWQTIAMGDIWRAEVKNKRKDGAFYWVDTFIMPLKNVENRITEYLSIRNDITEKKENELKLQQALLKAEESDHLKSAFLANISHEIRTPMNAIMGFAELLDRPNVPEDKRAVFSQLIHDRSVDLLNIVNDILDISKIEAGHISSAPVVGNIAELFKRLLLTFHAETYHLRNKKISMRAINELKGDKNVVLADFLKLNQVLTNLLTNAAKFTKEGAIQFGCQLLNAKVLLFTVRDTGIGIPPSQLDVIFKPFHQADSIIHQQYGGSGLGLAICKGLVELWGGRIWVESKLNEGSTFYFTMPYTQTNNG